MPLAVPTGGHRCDAAAILGARGGAPLDAAPGTTTFTKIHTTKIRTAIATTREP
jgi:hypothetical protein